MNRDVSRTGGGGVVAVPKISPELRKILNRREVLPSYGLDAGTDGGGEFRRGPWIKPDWVDGRDQAEARAALPAFEHLAGPVPEQAMVDFLNFIWVTTKHSSELTWQGVCVAYPRVLRQFPAYCWRPDKLDLVPHAFPTWFPTAGELAAFLMPDKIWLEEEIAGLRGVAEANTRARPRRRPWDEGGEEDATRVLREKGDRERKEMARIAAEKYGDPPVPERGPGESDDLFLARLKQHRAEVEKRATREMKRPYSPIKRMNDRPAPPPTPDAMRKAYASTGIKPEDVREPADAEVPS
jgi:hypothetical protein